MKSIVAQVFLMLLIRQSYGLRCLTCRGNDCDTASQYLECNRNIPKLPFDIQDAEEQNDIDVEYGCLDLEYQIAEGTLTKIKQCILLSSVAVCDRIAQVTVVNKCDVTNFGRKMYNARESNETPVSPNVTIADPNVTAAAPNTTTAAPAVTTSAPNTTAAAPNTTTAAPAVTTSAPNTTAVANVTTTNPNKTTASPNVTTASPNVTSATTTVPPVSPNVTVSPLQSTTPGGAAMNTVPILLLSILTFLTFFLPNENVNII